MRYLSVCSGIEAATVAWEPLGWRAAAYSEIERFPSAVLTHHYPNIANHGDMTKFREWPDAAIDVLVGGTPCQSFSVAGLRAGLADPRGNLMLVYLAIAERFRPRWLVWENVPGVLSSGRGRDFGALLGGLAGLGYGFSWRVLDAQYFGLAQRRRRVFVVGHLGDWRRAAAVLFERESLSGHPAPRRKTGQGITAHAATGLESGVGQYHRIYGTDDPIATLAATGGAGGAFSHAVAIASTLAAGGHGRNPLDETLVPYTLAIRGRGDSHDLEYRQDGTANAILTPNGGRGGIGVGAIAFDARQSDVIQYGEKTGPLDTDGHTIAIAFAENQRGEVTINDTAGSLKAGGGKPGQGYPAVAYGVSNQPTPKFGVDVCPSLDAKASGGGRMEAVSIGMQVRRLTPRECERLQGFPDDYTLIPYGNGGKPSADGPRYKALGNSMAVPVMRWIGKRIAMVDAL